VYDVQRSIISRCWLHGEGTWVWLEIRNSYNCYRSKRFIWPLYADLSLLQITDLWMLRLWPFGLWHRGDSALYVVTYVSKEHSASNLYPEDGGSSSFGPLVTTYVIVRCRNAEDHILNFHHRGNLRSNYHCACRSVHRPCRNSVLWTSVH
jgi:hypothetical protein